MTFTLLDAVILVLYLAGITYFGIWIAGKQTSAKDYYLGGKEIPWWAACFAIVATETSTLTFISIPGVAYATNLNFLQVTFGYFLGRIVVAYVILPAYFRGELATAYAYLGQRFGSRMKNLASGVFMGTRLAADGVRLFATAIPLAIILEGALPGGALADHWIYIISITLIAFASLSYTYVGGLRAVVWMDVVQLALYIGGAAAAIVLLLRMIPGGLAEALSQARIHDKLDLFQLVPENGIPGFVTEPYTLAASIIGGAFLSMATHGTDQLIVQRLLAIGSLKESRRALILTGAIIVFQFALFLFLGLLLFSFYGGADITPDEVFPRFIIEEMPAGLSGLIVAALFAAAMSTLSSSMTALSSATMYDYVAPYWKGLTRENEVRTARLITFVWCVLLVGSAIAFMGSPQAVVELALSIASFTFGGLLGAYFLGVLFPAVREQHAIPAFLTGIAVMTLVIVLPMLFDGLPVIAWTWYTLIGSGATVATGAALSVMRKPDSAP